MKQANFKYLRRKPQAMPVQKYLYALRENVAKNLARYETKNRRSAAGVAEDVKNYLESVSDTSISITRTDISRCKNVTGGASGEGASISPAKLGVLERFLKEKESWRQYVQENQSLEKRYYSLVADMIMRGEKDQPEIIDRFSSKRRNVERGSEPEILGYYSVIRRSMHSLGDFNRSKILFKKNCHDNDIYEFSEERKIEKRTGLAYTITYSGFVNIIRNTYILHGMSYVEGTKTHHYTPFPEMTYIHNDRDVNRLVGIWTSVTRENSHPCSTPIIMRTISEEKFCSLELGLVDKSEIDAHDLETFERALDTEKGMLYINGNFEDF